MQSQFSLPLSPNHLFFNTETILFVIGPLEEDILGGWGFTWIIFR